MTVRIEHDQLVFSDDFRVSFQRTLRIPDDGRRHPLPPGLGCFPLRRVDDHLERVPESWRARGGVFLPMYQREAMWLYFDGPDWKPHAVKVGVGKVCAVTGRPWSDRLNGDRQDYLVAPPQPWLDGICVARGSIRQFVAMPLGSGYTIEGQVTGVEVHGGLQIRVFDAKPGRFPDEPPRRSRDVRFAMGAPPAACHSSVRSASMGLAAGGRMKQKIYPDPHGVDTWDQDGADRLFVHIVNSELWQEITGEPPPESPVTMESYVDAGLPWFDLYDEHAAALEAGATLAAVKGTAELDADRVGADAAGARSLGSRVIERIRLRLDKSAVRDGDWS